MLVIVHLRMHVRDSVDSLCTGIGVCGIVKRYLGVDCGEEVGKGVSFAHGVVGHVKTLLGLHASLLPYGDPAEEVKG